MATARQIGIAVVLHAGRCLIGVRGPNGPLPGKAEFPGGKCESDETPQACAVRECLEETGLRVVAETLLDACEFTYPHGTVALQFWRCRPANPDDVADDHAGFRWRRLDELTSLDLPEANARAVARLRMLSGTDAPSSE